MNLITPVCLGYAIFAFGQGQTVSDQEAQKYTRNNSDSEKYCSNKNLRLPGSSSHVISQMKSHMTRYNVTSAWLGIKREDHKQWQWLDGTIYAGKEVLRYTATGKMNCASVRGSNVYATDCLTNTKGFLCQLDCRTCGLGRCHHFNKINKADGCYTVGQQETTWFQADMECKRQGGSLLQRTNVLNQVLQKDGETDYWIGLIRSGWYEQHEGTGKLRVSSGSWSPQAETVPDERCAVIESSGEWRAVSCDETHPAICISDFLVLNTTGSPSTTDWSQSLDEVTALYDSETTIELCPAQDPITWLMSSWRCLATSGLAVIVVLVTIVIEVYRCGSNRRLKRCKTCTGCNNGNQEMHAFPNLYRDHRRESCRPSSGCVDLLPDPNQECYASVDEVKSNRGARHAETGRISLPPGFDTYGGSNISMATALTAPLPVTMMPCNSAFYTNGKVCQKAWSQLQIGRPQMEVSRYSSTLPPPDHSHGSFYEDMSGESSQRIHDVRNQHY